MSGLTWADLDVNVPIGTPLDRLTFQARILRPQLNRPETEQPSEPDKNPAPKISIEDEFYLRDGLGGLLHGFTGSSEPLEAAGITTKDALRHTPWDHMDRNIYPRLNEKQKMMIYAEFLRMMMYSQSKFSMLQQSVFMQCIGEPCMQHFDDTDDAWEVKDIMSVVKRTLNSGEGDRYKGKFRFDIEKDSTWRQQQLYKTLTIDLCSGYDYFKDRRYVEKIQLLASLPETQAMLIQVAKKHRYKLVRRNATALLSDIPTKEAKDALLKLAADSDLIVSYRAILALLRRHEKEVVPRLIKRLRGGYTYQNIFVVDTLGRFGQKTAIPALLKWYHTLGKLSGADFREVSWVLLPALIRLNAKSDEALKYYKICAKTFKRGDALDQLALLANVISGDKKARKVLMSLVQKDGNPLKNLNPSVQLVAAELFAREGQTLLGWDVSLQILLSNNAPEMAQFVVLQNMSCTKEQLARLDKKLKGSSFRSPLLGAVLIQAARNNKESATTMAFHYVESYLRSDTEDDPATWSHIPVALRILYHENKIDEPLLLVVLEKSYEAFAYSQEPVRVGKKIFKRRAPSAIFEMAVGFTVALKFGSCTDYLLQCLQDEENTARVLIIRNVVETNNLALIEMLLSFLKDRNPWLRFCSALSLEQISGQTFDADWLNKNPRKCKDGQKFWDAWWDGFQKASEK